MNAKKCKAMRQATKAVAAFRRETEGVTLPPNGLKYKDTQKVSGFRTPSGWIKERFILLLSTLPQSPWAIEARQACVPEYKRIAVNTPGSPRWLYRKAKKASK